MRRYKRGHSRRRHRFRDGTRKRRPFRRPFESPVYRARDGIVFGVCLGLARYFDFNVFWIRAVCVVMLFLSGLWPILGLYILASFIMKPEPVRPITSDDEREFYDSYVNSPQNAAQRIKQRYQSLEKRIRRMEDAVTSREFEWERKMNS